MNDEKKWYDQDHFNDPELEPVPKKSGEFRKVKKSDNIENEKKSDFVPDINEIKKEIFEADAIEAGRLEDTINEVIYKGGEGEHPNYNLKAEPIEFPTEPEEKKVEIKKKKPLNDSHEFNFK